MTQVHFNIFFLLIQDKKHPLRSAFRLIIHLTAYAINSFTSAAKFLGSSLIPGPIVVDR